MANKRGRWSDIPSDIIFIVVNQKKLSLADVARMATICKSWRSILLENDWFGLPINGNTLSPWLMLAESTSCNRDMRGFFNPATGQVREIYLPEAKGRRCCGSSHGWIVTMGEDMEINLLNPLTREELNLPSQLTFSHYGNGDIITNGMLHEEYTIKEILSIFITKAILTCSPRETECVVVAVLAAETDLQVVFARPGDPTWTLLPHLHPIQDEGREIEALALVEDFLFYEGKLFCITFHPNLLVLDSYHDPERKWKVISSTLRDTFNRVLRPANVRNDFYCVFNFYLVLIAGEFVVVVRGKERRGENNYKTRKIAVFKLLEKGDWCKINEIGDCCLFLGTNMSTCLSPTPHGYSPNCIYLTDDLYFIPGYRTIAGEDMVVYSMENNKFTPFYYGEGLLSEFSPSLWVTLN